MRQRKALVRKILDAVNARAARAISIQEVAALHHEVLNDAVEFAAFVALRPAEPVFRLARAVLPKVFGGARHGVRVELNFDAAERFAAERDVEEDDGVGGVEGRGHCHLCWV